MAQVEQKRIWMWAIPRSLSTAFLRAMLSRESCRGYMEPWFETYFMSADRISNRFPRESFPDKEGFTFKEVKARLEAYHEGYKEVFVKDFSCRLKTFMDSGSLTDVVPEGYVHTFLIRHPAKTVASLSKITEAAVAGIGQPIPGFRPEEASFFEMVQMHDYITKTLGQKSIIVDADDIEKDPEGILRLYCDAVGIAFQDSMVNWNPLTKEQLQKVGFDRLYDWVKLAAESKGFIQKDSGFPNVEELPEVVQKCIQDNLPCYEKLYEKRLKVVA